MKKIISVIAALSLVTTVFASLAHAAADVTFTAAGVKPSYAVGANAVVRMTITSPNGFAGFKTTLSYDNDTFEFVRATKSADLDGTLVDDTSNAGTVVHAFGSAKNQMPTKIVLDEETYEEVETACNYTITYIFKVKENAYNGDYKFAIESDPANLRNASNTIITGDTSGAIATITVTGGQDVSTLANFEALNAAIANYESKTEADYTEASWATAKAAYDAAKAIDQTAEADQSTVDAAATALSDAIAALEAKPVDKVEVKADDVIIKKDNASKLWTFGFGGTVEITGNAGFTKLVFDLKDTANGKTGSYTWDLGTSISTTVTYGLNIMSCPVDSNITATVTAE